MNRNFEHTNQPFRLFYLVKIELLTVGWDGPVYNKRRDQWLLFLETNIGW